MPGACQEFCGEMGEAPTPTERRVAEDLGALAARKQVCVPHMLRAHGCKIKSGENDFREEFIAS